MKITERGGMLTIEHLARVEAHEDTDAMHDMIRLERDAAREAQHRKEADAEARRKRRYHANKARSEAKKRSSKNGQPASRRRSPC